MESKAEGIVVSSVEEGRLAHVQGRPRSTAGFVLVAVKCRVKWQKLYIRLWFEIEDLFENHLFCYILVFHQKHNTQFTYE